LLKSIPGHGFPRQAEEISDYHRPVIELNAIEIAHH
jgi:hypothetical protein